MTTENNQTRYAVHVHNYASKPEVTPELKAVLDKTIKTAAVYTSVIPQMVEAANLDLLGEAIELAQADLLIMIKTALKAEPSYFPGCFVLQFVTYEADNWMLNKNNAAELKIIRLSEMIYPT